MKHFKQVFIKDNNDEKGVGMLIVVSFLTLIFVSISIAIARTNLLTFQSLQNLKHSRHAYYLSETGIEDTVIRIEEDVTYSGNPSGETTPIGTYYATVDRTIDDYTVTAYAQEVDTRRELTFDFTLIYEIPDVVTKATYMADFFVIYGEGARIRGDVWTNDDFEVIEHGVVEGNLASAGKGSFAVNWVWDGIVGGNPTLQGGEVIDNPDTPELDGNLIAADSVKVSGPSAYVQGNVTSESYVWELFGGTIDGEVSEYATLEWEEIPVPIFDFEEYEQQAISKGTYFGNANSFENYLDSIDTGTERRLPEDVYYIASGALKVEAGSPVYIDGLLVVEDNLYIYSEWYQNAQSGLPAIVSGKSINIENKFNFWSFNYDHAGPVSINGIVFAEKDVSLLRTFDDENITIQGAVWAGDDVFVKTNSFIKYDLDPLNIQGFNFVTGIADLIENYWQENI